MAKKSKGKPPKAKPAKKAAERKPFKAPISTKTGEPESGGKIETMRVTPGTTLKSLLSTCRGYKANSDSIISKMREEIGYAVEKKHLDKGAFADLRRFDKMEAEKAAERWHTLVRYMELSGVMAKIDAVGRLPLGDDDGDGEEIEAKPAAAPKSKAKEKANGNGAAAEPDADAVAAAANTDALRTGIKPAAAAAGDVSKPHFGQTAVGQAPGGSVHMLPDRKQAH